MKTNNEYQLLYRLRELFPSFAFELNLIELNEVFSIDKVFVYLVSDPKIFIKLDIDTDKEFSNINDLVEYISTLVNSEPLLKIQ